MKISFVVPVYNGEKYIEKCINSLIALDLVDYEIIIINDGSTDNTSAIVAKLSKNNPEIKIFDINNSGLSCARNKGMDVAVGEYVVFVDSDDWISREFLQVIDMLNKNEELDVIYYAARDVVEFENFAEYNQIEYKVDCNRVYSGEDILRIAKNYNFQHEAWRGIYRKAFFQDNCIKFLPGLIYEDNAFWFEVMSNAKRVMYSNIVAYNYLIRTNSIVHSEISHRNIMSVYDNIKAVFSKDNMSENYMLIAAYKMVVLLKSCELRCSTKNRDKVVRQCVDFEGRKVETIDLIERIYNENNPNLLKAKYLLLSNLVFFMGYYNDKMVARVSDLREKITKYFRKCYVDWDLSSNDERVGIYGRGRCSDVVLNTYEKLFGQINNDVVYIDSYKKSNLEKHYNRKVININDVNEFEIDKILVASNLYEKAMIDNVKNQYPDIKVTGFFGENDLPIEFLITQNFYEIMRKIENIKNKKKIFLIGTPEYPNVGDHLITKAEYLFFDKYYSGYEIIEITNEDYQYYKLRLKNLIGKNDLLIVTGGGFFGSLWFHGHFDGVLDLVEAYPDNKIIVMPQSIYFSEDSFGESTKLKTKEVFERCDLKVCWRDYHSFGRFSNLNISKCSIGLFPDIALYYSRENSSLNLDSDKVGWYIRNDKESIVNQDILECIRSKLVEDGMEICENSMQYDSMIFKEDRDLVIDEKLDEIAKYCLVITDQLHCMISCYITNTPCIALNNISKKVDGVYEWIKCNNSICVINEYQDFLERYKNIMCSENSISKKEIDKQEWDNLYKFISG